LSRELRIWFNEKEDMVAAPLTGTRGVGIAQYFRTSGRAGCCGAERRTAETSVAQAMTGLIGERRAADIELPQVRFQRIATARDATQTQGARISRTVRQVDGAACAT
jgi:hypothetical protein